MGERDRMLAGEIYNSRYEDLLRAAGRARSLLAGLAAAPAHDHENRYGILTKLFGGAGNAWIGGGTIVLGGVTIADNVTIGAGSVVTKDIPSDVPAFGNPCRVHRSL